MEENSWEKAKDILDNMEFPDVVGTIKRAEEFHMVSKQRHSLDSYQINLPPVLGYEVIGYYNYCKQCGEIRNKSLVIFNEKKHSCYEKQFVFHGKLVW